MPHLDVSFVLRNMAFKEPFTIYRFQGQGQYVNGRYVVPSIENATKIIATMGIVVLPNSKNLTQTEYGDITGGQAVFYSTIPLYLSNANGISDYINWKGDTYRLLNLWDFSSYGYYKAIGVKIEGV